MAVLKGPAKPTGRLIRHVAACSYMHDIVRIHIVLLEIVIYHFMYVKV